MTSPFDDPDASYLVLVNALGQYSLWPGFAQVPAGWRIARGRGSRDECLAYVDRVWTDQRPPAPAAAAPAPTAAAPDGREVVAP
ncbi:MbtH family protein [Kitasatospora sp. NPDC057512]|uniref:MbtH family protein n=1 Tax=Kitasatospora sp. NPDC057512 TaxID=3346154 RepID=UPI003698B9AC